MEEISSQPVDRELLRISVLASCVAMSSSFLLWPFASFFQANPTTVAPAYHFPTTTPPPLQQQNLPAYQPAYDVLSAPANQDTKLPASMGLFTNSISDNKQPLFEMPPSSSHGVSQPMNTQKSSAAPVEGKSCTYEGKQYKALTEISNGRSGDWCYGTYCNHEGKVVHWDDLNCPLSIEPTPTPTTEPAPSDAGCIYHGVWYPAGYDIDNYAMYGMCYGTYCDWTSRVVNWEDNCYATVPTIQGVPTPKPDIFKKK